LTNRHLIGYSHKFHPRNCHPFCNSKSYEDIVGALQHTDHPIIIAREVGIDWQIEFLWEIDIDNMTFAMVDKYSHRIVWSWKFLQLIGDVWLSCAKKYNRANNNKVMDGVQETTIVRCVTKLQACVRRFLEIRRALQPPNGILYRMAQNDFYKRSAASGAAASLNKNDTVSTASVISIAGNEKLHPLEQQQSLLIDQNNSAKQSHNTEQL
jgi:hypothetical protein